MQVLETGGILDLGLFGPYYEAQGSSGLCQLRLPIRLDELQGKCVALSISSPSRLPVSLKSLP